ncbi:PspC domain-containing protein [Marinoscillum sp. MHG1-6]|uniref:PspC domain-containing protein n=1 Tax=Marinoscillum sp. MHG1-6 TaxID=2959627 RepID=UPI0021582F2B|nr:PspC domain-containing protein [Marinoscillum sp. MHG1-6]
MKKTISINIGGIIFHIEEDGYDKLKQYLDSINRYFSTFEESSEIMSDIEGRIAELFLMKLNDGRQTLNVEDINELIATMGTTTDFEASIEEDAPESEQEKQEEKTKTDEAPKEEAQEAEPKRLFRDTNRGLIGGVAAGIAHYFGVDPLWVRLLFLALLINIFFYGLSTAIFVAYIILWFVMPPSDDLQENTKIKKLYRNNDDRVLGGVAAGIAAYFGVDVVVIRLLFVLTLFLGGSGALLYIVLWIITPIAKTVTEKMQMSGQPVTLQNIEDSLKKSFKMTEGEEKPLTKVLLFPFRLLAALIQGIGRILGPLLKFVVDVVRVLFGAILVFAGFIMTAALIGMISALYGSSGNFMVEDFLIPFELIQQSINGYMLVGVFFITIIPALFLAILGLVVISKKWLINSAVGWSLFTIWVVGIILGAVTIPSFVSEFHQTADIQREEKFALTDATPVLKLNNLGGIDWDGVDLMLRGQSDSVYTALIETESRGQSRTQAQANAAMVDYAIRKDGEDIYFNSNYTFNDSAKFRFQHVNVTFFIPYGKVFRMDEDLSDILFNTIHQSGYRVYDIPGNDWVFKQGEGLVCLTCTIRSDDDDDISYYGPTDDLDVTPRPSYDGVHHIDYPFEKFDQLVIGSVFDLEISRADEFKVVLYGDEELLEDVYLNQVGDRLEVNFKRDEWKWWKKQQKERIKLQVKMPHLTDLEIQGACDGDVIGFDEEQMNITIEGVSDLYVNVNVTDLDIDLEGIASIDLVGKGLSLDANVEGASNLNSLNYLVDHIDIEAEGASKATVFGSKSIEARADGASTIRYKGNSNINIEEDGNGSVKRY